MNIWDFSLWRSDHDLLGDLGEDLKDTGNDGPDADGHPADPGGSLYYAMDAALRRDMPQFIVKGQAAIGLAIALAAGSWS